LVLPFRTPVTRTPSNLAVWGYDTNRAITDMPKYGAFLSIAPGGATQLLALRENGRPVLWGGVGAAQPATGTDPAHDIIPPLTEHQTDLYHHIALGITCAAAIRNDDQWIDTWGKFPGGADSSVPPEHRGRKFVAVAVGGGQIVAITTGDTLVEWGPTSSTPPNPPNTRFRQIRSRSDYNVAIDAQGNLYGWGGGLFVPPTPLRQPNPLEIGSWPWTYDWEQRHWYRPGSFGMVALGLPVVKNGPAHVLALFKDIDDVRNTGPLHGTLAYWGDDQFGQSSKAPFGVRFWSVAAGKGFSIGLDLQYNLRHWGDAGMPLAVGAPGPLAILPNGPFEGIGAGANQASAWRPNTW
jgi:hypothetical protein